jgi:hypothetical protein
MCELPDNDYYKVLQEENGKHYVRLDYLLMNAYAFGAGKVNQATNIIRPRPFCKNMKGC